MDGVVGLVPLRGLRGGLSSPAGLSPTARAEVACSTRSRSSTTSRPAHPRRRPELATTACSRTGAAARSSLAAKSRSMEYAATARPATRDSAPTATPCSLPLSVWSPDGVACSDDDQCVNTCVKGTCAPEGGAGEPCDAVGDCALFACLTVPGSATCTDQLCQCPSGSFCSHNDQCVGTCAGASCRAINTVCDTGDAADCTGAFTCVEKRCVLPEGSSCTANSVCRSALPFAGVQPARHLRPGVATRPPTAPPASRASKSGTCLLQAGATCSTPSSCASNKCSCTRFQLHEEVWRLNALKRRTG